MKSRIFGWNLIEQHTEEGYISSTLIDAKEEEFTITIPHEKIAIHYIPFYFLKNITSLEKVVTNRGCYEK